MLAVEAKALETNLEGSFDLVKGVGETGHEFGVLKIGRCVLAYTISLDGEGSRLEAEFLAGVLTRLNRECLRSTVDSRTLVRRTGSLNLHVCLALYLVVR